MSLPRSELFLQRRVARTELIEAEHRLFDDLIVHYDTDEIITGAGIAADLEEMMDSMGFVFITEQL